MLRVLIVFVIAIVCAGCASGSKQLDSTSMITGSAERLSKEAFIARFGEPLATKEMETHTFLGYRRRDSTMSAWSLVPFVGLVAGGVHEDFTTCIAKVSKATNIVEDVNCTTERNFQSNAETMVGDIITQKEINDIFGAPLKK